MYAGAHASARQVIITLENRSRRGEFLAAQPVKYTDERVPRQLSGAIAIHRQLQARRVAGAQLRLMNNNQSGTDKCAAAKADHARIIAECGAGSSSSSASPCWPPPSSSTVNNNSNSNSFFRQLFADDEDTGAVVDGLLLQQPSPSAAFEVGVGDDKFSADSVFQLGAFPMVDSFMDAATIASDSAADAGQPHTLEFVTSPNYIADSPTSADHDLSCAEPSHRHSMPEPRHLLPHDPAHGDNPQDMTPVKKPKILSPADSHGGSQFQPPLHKVSHSQQTARSKEKLGERINALQQLVSPYGKTDTASVLSEAIGYIKFLQEQVQVLSSPYMKPTNTVSAINRQDLGAEAASDLRSRGLCLVPVSCTMTVANNNNFNIGADYWASTQNFTGSLASGGAASTRFSAV